MEGQTAVRRIETVEDLAAGVSALGAADPRLAALARRHGLPPLRRAEGGLKGLLRIVMDQQISLRAGAAIWARLEARYRPFEAAVLARATPEELRACGLSAAKIRTCLALADAAATGALDFAALEDLPDAEAAARLTAFPGIGPWTADIYLLACLGRADAWPAGDLALQVAAGLAFDLADRPDARAMAALAEPWRPWRAVAARLLWTHYRAETGLPPA